MYHKSSYAVRHSVIEFETGRWRWGKEGSASSAGFAMWKL